MANDGAESPRRGGMVSWGSLAVLREPLPLAPIIATGFLFLDPSYATEPVIATVAASWCFCVLHKIPFVARMMHARPTYLDDIEEPFSESESSVEREMRMRYRRAFNNTVILSTSLTLGVVVEYGLFRLHDSHLEILELAGVIGGLISLFGDAHTLIGKAMIALLHFQRERFKKAQAKRRREIERGSAAFADV